MTCRHMNGCMHRRRIHRLARDVHGVSTIEFAIVLPFFLFAIMGALEIGNYALTYQRLNALTAQMADAGARVPQEIDESDVAKIMMGANVNATTLDLRARGRIMLSSVQRNAANNGNWIRWQRCSGDKKAETSIYGPQDTGRTGPGMQGITYKGNTINPPAGSAVIIAETAYTYRPIIANGFINGIALDPDMRMQTAHIVRQRTALSIKNDAAAADADRNLCNT